MHPNLPNLPNPSNPPNQCAIAFPLVRDRFLAFVTEQFPFAATAALSAFDRVVKSAPANARAIDGVRAPLARALRSAVTWPAGDEAIETTPAVSVKARRSQSVDELVAAIDGFLVREAIAAGLSDDERLEILRGMILTRAVDTRLKIFFSGSEVRYGNTPFQGKGFRSLGQEAIYAAAIRLRRGSTWRRDDGTWEGDVIGPIIRDVGAALAMRHEPATVRMVLNAQMGKAGPPMDGRDLHIGDFEWGIVPATAPLSVSSLTVAGMALAFKRARAAARRRVVHRRRRVVPRRMARSDQHVRGAEAAGDLLPAEQPDGALDAGGGSIRGPRVCRQGGRLRHSRDSRSTAPIRKRSRRRSPGPPIARARGRARRSSSSSRCACAATRITTTCCTSARIRSRRGTIRRSPPQGYADPKLYEFWRARDPIPAYAKRLESRGLLKRGDLARLEAEADAIVEAEAQAVIAAAVAGAARP